MVHLNDWLTTHSIPFASKITFSTDDILHDHAFFEIFYMIDGAIDHTLNGVTTTLHAGDILFLRPEDAHMFLREEGNVCRHRDLIFRKSFFKTVCNYLSPNLYSDFINGKLNKSFHLSLHKINEFEQVFEKISAIPPYETELILASLRRISAEVLGLLLTEQVEKSFNYPKWFQELLIRFEDTELVCQGLDAILAEIFYTKEHVCRVFKEIMGMTMTDYLNKKRLEIAANMLVCSYQQVVKISTDLGFSSVSYFNKIFKAKYGLTPIQFRKNFSSQH